MVCEAFESLTLLIGWQCNKGDARPTEVGLNLYNHGVMEIGGVFRIERLLHIRIKHVYECIG